MNKTLKEQLRNWKNQQQEVKQCRKPWKRRTEKLTEFELKSLMDVNKSKRTSIHFQRFFLLYILILDGLLRCSPLNRE